MAGSQVLCLTANTVGSGSHSHPEQVAEPPSGSFLSQATDPGGKQRNPWWGVRVMGASEAWTSQARQALFTVLQEFAFYFLIFSLIFSSPLFMVGFVLLTFPCFHQPSFLFSASLGS